MSKKYIKPIIKVLILSTFLAVIINIGDNLINANGVNKNYTKNISNSQNFKKVNNSSLGKTGVAISTNIGIRYKQRKEIPATIYKDVFSINEVVTNQDGINDEIIDNNMVLIEEYRNILKTNIKQLLANSHDKPRILNALIEQLEFRYVQANKNINKLNEQKNIFNGDMQKSDLNIKELKRKIETDFTKNDSAASLENIDKFLEYKKEFYFAKTYISYINHFLYEYQYLNNYNKNLLDVLILNKEALVKDSFVVIPDSGIELLRNFNLIYTEEEYKK